MLGPHMKYTVEITKRANKDLKNIPKRDIKRIIDKINEMKDGLKGDIKKLSNYTPEYRLRHGNWRVLFEVEGDKIVIYRIINRKDAYRFGG